MQSEFFNDKYTGVQSKTGFDTVLLRIIGDHRIKLRIY